MNYDPMWRVVDAHRRCADELERTLREVTDDPIPVYHQSASEGDDIDSYDFVLNTLIEARNQLWAMADRRGHTVRSDEASRCNVFARHCDKAFSKLARKGEL